MRFALPELLQAEHEGRALALHIAGDRVDVLAAPGLDGSAALAAARHAFLLGYDVQVLLLPHNGDKLSEAYEAQLAAARSLKIRLTEIADWNAWATASTVIDGGGRCAHPGAEAIVHPRDVRREPSVLWDRYSVRFGLSENPYLNVAREADARSAAEVRAVDRAAIEQYGIPGLCLMENAGIGAAVIASQMLFEHRGSGPVVVLVGPGNNGGDALVVARGLIEKGEDVRVLCLQPPDRFRGDAAANAGILRDAGIDLTVLPDDPQKTNECLAGARLIVDGLFGTGLDRAIEGRAAELITSINRSARPVLALDLPSGLHADSGDVLGVAVRAERTVTFAAPKPGLFRSAGPEHVGREPVVASIGCPGSLVRTIS